MTETCSSLHFLDKHAPPRPRVLLLVPGVCVISAPMVLGVRERLASICCVSLELLSSQLSHAKAPVLGVHIAGAEWGSESWVRVTIIITANNGFAVPPPVHPCVPALSCPFPITPCTPSRRPPGFKVAPSPASRWRVRCCSRWNTCSITRLPPSPSQRFQPERTGEGALTLGGEVFRLLNGFQRSNQSGRVWLLSAGRGEPGAVLDFYPTCLG